MGARIYKKIENNMQRGSANGKGWILEYDNPQQVRADPLTGWAGGGETQGQVKIGFPSAEAAIAYAEREGIDYHVVPVGTRTLKIQTYAENFK
jgi:hypothetical protein